MFAMPRLRLLGALVIGSALAVLLTLVVYSPAAQAHHSWGKYHWARTTTSFNLKLGDNVSSGWDTYLNATASSSDSDWSDSSVLDTNIVTGRTTGATCAPTSGRVEVCNAAYGTNGWLGLAQIWIGRRSHTFGLDHQDENHTNTNLGTCMDYTNDPSGTLGTNGTLSNEHPNQGDYDELLCVYAPAYNGVTLSTTTHSCTGTGHLDRTTTVAPASAASTMPPAASRGDLNSRAQWGQLIRQSRNERLALYERNFGGGKKLVTFVIWA